MPIHRAFLLPEDELIEDKGAAEVLGLSNFRTLSNWRSNDTHPDLPYLRIGRSIRYRLGDLLEFRKRHTVGGVTAVQTVNEQVTPSPSTSIQIQTQATSTLAKSPQNVVRPSDLLRQGQVF